ncbi:hypothetical protein EDF68_1324 [Ochrobactrum sp. BH3]|nr:hypothetical protein EDF68_1324 [Ochrobactrum sp. BH3]
MKVLTLLPLIAALLTAHTAVLKVNAAETNDGEMEGRGFAF